uniref:Uncharacterized protein n=1 Tax=Anguilla anguilla TaxID=7936 RepID=A0A0E9PC23_ANGAN
MSKKTHHVVPAFFSKILPYYGIFFYHFLQASKVLKQSTCDFS